MAAADPALVSLGIVVVAGILATLVASRVNLPSILLLLAAGFLVGPITGWVDPDHLLGELLFPVVSFSVGVILFEGGLTLQLPEVEETAGVVRNLVTVGVLITWILGAVGAHLLVGLDLGLALLLGAIFTVTGPTVVTPLLHHLRPDERVANVLKWEGIVIDPVGAILAVLVFEALLAGGLDEAVLTVAQTVGTALGAGVVLGVAGAAFLYVLLRRHWVPDLLQSPVTLAVVLGVFTVSEVIQPESGLVTATVMGAVLANRGDITKRHIIEFKENLRVLLISFLFIILGARLDPDAALQAVSAESLAFLGVMILVIRPLAVAASTVGSDLDLRERAFVAGVAPRGVVAAAISSVFAIELAEAGFPGAERLVPLSFLLIVGTVLVYGLAAGPLGRLLGVVPDRHDGVLLVGSHPWARHLGVTLQEAGIPVKVVDTDRYDLRRAEEMGLSTFRGNPVHEAVLEEMDLAGIGHFVALTRHDQGNALAVLHFQEEFDRANAYQLPPSRGDDHEEAIPPALRGRLLGCDLTWHEIQDRYDEGWRFGSMTLEGEDPEVPEDVRPFALVRDETQVVFCTEDRPLNPQDGDVLVALLPPEDDAGGGE